MHKDAQWPTQGLNLITHKKYKNEQMSHFICIPKKFSGEYVSKTKNKYKEKQKPK